jgi:2-oxoisovalerate dehydrogenase E1 component alpha subunit
LIEWVTYRVAAHSTSDDPSRYRPADEWKAWPLGDPIERLERHLTTVGGWSEEDGARLRADAAERVRAAAREAESAGTLLDGQLPSARSIFEDVFETMPPHLQEQQRQLESGQ